MKLIRILLGAIACLSLTIGVSHAFKVKDLAKPKKALKKAKTKAEIKTARKICAKMGKAFKHSHKGAMHYCLAKKLNIPKKSKVKPMCGEFNQGKLGFAVTVYKGMKPYKCPKFMPGKPTSKDTSVCMRTFKLPKIAKKVKRIKPYCKEINKGKIGISLKF
ncbi:MAG: hypothetical protein VX589_14565 [Myxococcota bacterium]|nr:hypothetical protein [Myxococcota bacterium]